MNAQNVVYPYKGTETPEKQECRTHTCYNADKSQKHHAKWKNPVIKEHVLHDFIGIECQINKSIDTERRLVVS